MPVSEDLSSSIKKHFSSYIAAKNNKDQHQIQLRQKCKDFMSLVDNEGALFSDFSLLSFLAVQALLQNASAPKFAAAVQNIIKSYGDKDPTSNCVQADKKIQQSIVKRLKIVNKNEKSHQMLFVDDRLELKLLHRQLDEQQLTAEILEIEIDSLARKIHFAKQSTAMLTMLDSCHLLLDTCTTSPHQLVTNPKKIKLKNTIELYQEKKSLCADVTSAIASDLAKFSANSNSCEKNDLLYPMLEKYFKAYCAREGYQKYYGIPMQDTHYTRLVTWFAALIKLSEGAIDNQYQSQKLLGQLAIQALMTAVDDPCFIKIVSNLIIEYQQRNPFICNITTEGLIITGTANDFEYEPSLINQALRALIKKRNEQQLNEFDLIETEKHVLREGIARWETLIDELQTRRVALTEEFLSLEKICTLLDGIPQIQQQLEQLITAVRQNLPPSNSVVKEKVDAQQYDIHLADIPPPLSKNIQVQAKKRKEQQPVVDKKPGDFPPPPPDWLQGNNTLFPLQAPKYPPKSPIVIPPPVATVTPLVNPQAGNGKSLLDRIKQQKLRDMKVAVAKRDALIELGVITVPSQESGDTLIDILSRALIPRAEVLHSSDEEETDDEFDSDDGFDDELRNSFG